MLDNWRQVGVSLDDIQLLGLFGEPVFVVPVATARSASPPSPSLVHAGERSMREERRNYISAVIVNEPLRRDCEDDFQIELQMRARVLHNPYASVPLPPKVFGRVEDEHVVRDGDVWRKLRGNEVG